MEICWLLVLVLSYAYGQMLYSTGSNTLGQMGLNDIVCRYTPTLINTTSLNATIASISGNYHSLLLSSTGFLYSTGTYDIRNGNQGDTADRLTPTLLAGVMSSLSIVAVAGGYRHTVAVVRIGGSVYTYGGNPNGGLGVGDTVDRYTPTLISMGDLSSISVTSVSAGGSNSFFLSKLGMVFGTGYNGFGQLGLNDATDRPTATLIAFTSSISIGTVSAGPFASILLSATGQAYSMGSNLNGELGLGDWTQRNTPTLMATPTSMSIISVAIAGFFNGTNHHGHSLVLSSLGFAYSTGQNDNGQLGLGDFVSRPTPTLLHSGELSTRSIVSITAASACIVVCSGATYPSTLLLTVDGAVFGCGWNGNGSLGLGDTVDRPTPTLITSLVTKQLSTYAIASGAGNSLFLTDSNECSSATQNNCNSDATCTNTVGSFSCACNLGYSGDGVTSCVRASAPRLYAFGYNYVGQLGLGDDTTRLTPMMINAMSLVSVAAVSAGWQQTLYLASTGKIWVTGQNVNGGLGLGDNVDRFTPTLISSGSLSSMTMSVISSGALYSMFISKDGLAYSTGQNDNGRLGLGDTTDRWTPTLITATGALQLVAASAGFSHMMLLARNGAVYCAGWNAAIGKLGLGDTTDRYTPTLITAGGLSTVLIKAISAGYYHSFVLSSLGNAYSFGYAGLGQLGLGNTVDRYTPTLVTFPPGVAVSMVSISASTIHSLMLSNAGRVYSTGWNRCGELGLGDTTIRLTPTSITTGEFSSISIASIGASHYCNGTCRVAGSSHSMLLSDQNRLYSMGWNGQGGLGIGDATDRYTPTLVNTGSMLVASMSVGLFYSVAVATSNDASECTSSRHNCNVNAVCGATAGSFTCRCNTGYNGDGVACNNINECATSNGGCISTCTNNVGSFTCSCSGAGFDSTHGTCTDINECTSNTHDCNVNALCTNTAGSFTCSCNIGYNGNGVSSCADINECTLNTHSCNTNATCTNTAGSFTCACNVGYNGNGTFCTDINECTANTHNCNTNALCANTGGSYLCVCNTGYNGNGTSCGDVNECTLNTHNCNPNAACTNTIGSFTCRCNVGYYGNGIICNDVDRCTTNIHNCNPDAVCTSIIGSFTCSCNAGYSGNGVVCNEVNKCITNTHNCNTTATCTYITGSFTCSCNAGYSGNGASSCNDINECTSNTHNCNTNALCANTISSFTCACNVGYNGNGVSCADLDECNIHTNICDVNARCINSIGSFACVCNAGFLANGTRCLDINECTSSSNHNCDKRNAVCFNFPGSFSCSCNSGYSGDGVNCDLDECFQGLHNCDPKASCANAFGSFTCRCNSGYLGDGLSCSKSQACNDDASPCDSHASCIPDAVAGSVSCICNAGYSGNGLSCVKVPWVVKTVPITSVGYGDGRFGASMSSVDLNGDSISDIVVGAPNDGNGMGGIYVLFGSSSTASVASFTKLSISYASSVKNVGCSISSPAADVDGDSVADLVVGTGSGFALLVLLRKNGTAKSTYPLLPPYWNITSSTATFLNDVNGDGVVDVLIAEPTGTIWLGYLAPGGSSIKSYTKILPSTPTRIRSSAPPAITATSGGFDVDGDGFNDLAVGYSSDNRVDLVFLNGTSVKSSASLRNGVGAMVLNADDGFGSSVHLTVDLNGDGIVDVLVGAPGDDTQGTDTGAVYLIFLTRLGGVGSFSKFASGQNGLPILNNYQQFGTWVNFAPYIGGDGYPSLIVSGISSTAINHGSVWRLAVDGLKPDSNGIPTISSSSSLTEVSTSFQTVLPETEVRQQTQVTTNVAGVAALISQFTSGGAPSMMKQAQFSALLNGDGNAYDSGSFVMGDVPALSAVSSAPGCRLYSRLFVLLAILGVVCAVRILVSFLVRVYTTRVRGAAYSGTVFVFPRWELPVALNGMFGIFDAAGTVSAGLCVSSSVKVGVVATVVLFLVQCALCLWLLYQIFVRTAVAWNNFETVAGVGRNKFLLWLFKNRFEGEWANKSQDNLRLYAAVIDPVIGSSNKLGVAVPIVMDILVRNAVTWCAAFFGGSRAVWFLVSLAALELVLSLALRPFRDQILKFFEPLAALARLVSALSVVLSKLAIIDKAVAIKILDASNIAGMICLFPPLIIQGVPVVTALANGVKDLFRKVAEGRKEGEEEGRKEGEEEGGKEEEEGIGTLDQQYHDVYRYPQRATIGIKPTTIVMMKPTTITTTTVTLPSTVASRVDWWLDGHNNNKK